MKSKLDPTFIALYRALPVEIKKLARKNYSLWVENSAHPSLRFKPVRGTNQIFSIRIGLGWRALGLVDDDTIVWFWIGSHAEYDKLLMTL